MSKQVPFEVMFTCAQIVNDTLIPTVCLNDLATKNTSFKCVCKLNYATICRLIFGNFMFEFGK